MASTALDHLGHLAVLQDAFLTSVGEVDPVAPVPWCGRWRVRDLVVHLARVHHWAAAEARGVREVPLGRGPFDLEQLYRDCATELRDTLVALGPDAVGSTLLGRGPVTFWHRRQLHETLVHLWDLRTAGGLDLDVAPEVWADTVDEVVTVMQPRQVRMGRMPPLPVVVGLAASDADGAWRLQSEADGDPAVRVRGPASALALLLWGRTTPDHPALGVIGNREALDSVLAQPLTP
jgi:uncharacterized protein (TIGR03083 family)